LLLALVLCLPGLGTVGAGAQAATEPLATCRNEAAASAERIAACARVIGETGDAGIRAEAHLQRGVLHEFDGREEAAVEDYSAAIKLDPANPLAWFNRGNAYTQLDQLELAIADYTQAIKLDAKEPDFFNNRGQAHDSKGQHDLAIADYTEAIRLDGKSARPFYNRGVSYANKGDYRRAVADFDLAIKVTPDPDIYVARGAAWEVLGDTNAARADFGKALEIDPDHEDAREGLNRTGG
jgi:tetratricopeptide (TPR) repeat protein